MKKSRVLMVEFNATGRRWPVKDALPIRAIVIAAEKEWGAGKYQVKFSVGRAWAVEKEHKPGVFRPVGVAVVTSERRAL